MPRGKTYANAALAIGETPMIRINRLVPEGGATVFAKCEFFQPLNSVKDRIGVAMIEAGERDGKINASTHIVEPTSGNTGIALAFVCAAKGYKLTLTMPESMSVERRSLLRGMGANLVLTPAAEGMKGAIAKAHDLVKLDPNGFMPQQFENPANPDIHEKTTGPEIWEQTEHKIDVFVAGAGTGGTISGVGKFLKSKKPDVKIVLADPIGSILYDLFYHKKVINPPKPYKVEGVGEDMLPDNVHFDVMDASVQVADKDAFSMTRRIIAEEGLCVGPSSAMALVAAIDYSKTLTKPSKIVVIFPDNGRAYMSKVFNNEWMKENGLL